MAIIEEYHAGPDDPIYKGGLRVSSVLGPSALTKNSQKGTDGAAPASAQPDPMQPAADAIEAYLKQGAMPLPNTDKEPKVP